LARQNANHLPTKILGGWQKRIFLAPKIFMKIVFFMGAYFWVLPTKTVGIFNENFKGLFDSAKILCKTYIL